MSLIASSTVSISPASTPVRSSSSVIGAKVPAACLCVYRDPGGEGVRSRSMSDRDEEKTGRVQDDGGIGAEGATDADRLPGEPSGGDDETPLGDTDQHSQVTDSGHDQMKR